MTQFQVIPNIKSNNVIATVTGEQIAEITRVGGGIHGVPYYRPAIIKLRGTKDEDEQKRIKETELPAFIPTAHYSNSSRASGSAYTLNQYVMLDIDGKDNPFLATQGQAFNNILPGNLVFNSPKCDGGRKVLLPVHLRNEYDYTTAFEQVTTLINKQLSSRSKPVLTFDVKAANPTQLCLFSYDVNADWNNDYDTIQPSYGKLASKPKRGANSLLSEAEWSSVDTSSVAGLFASTVSVLASKGIVWGKGTDAFLTEIYRLKQHGVGLPELLNLVHQHANGKYSHKHPKQTVTAKLTRLYNAYLTYCDTPVTAALPESNRYTFDAYLTEYLQEVWTHLQQQGTIYIDAPTGAGKTTLIAQLARLSGLKIDLLCPTTALAQQQHGVGVGHITGDGMLEESHYDVPVLACCFESIAKIAKRQASVLVIDEAHELASAYNYRSKAIQEIERYSENYKYVVYLSGSMFPIIRYANANRVLTFERKVKRTIPYDIVTLSKREKDADYFASTLIDGALNVFYKNDKTQLKALASYLEKAGRKVLLVSAEHKEDAGYRALIDEETLLQYDVVLTTCLLQSGVNVKDTRPVSIVFGLGCSLLDYIQFTARFRAIIPSIQIIHSGEVRVMSSLHEESLRNQLEALASVYETAKQKQRQLKMNEKSFLQPSLLDGIKTDSNGSYCVDDYFLLYKRYQTANNNVRTNILELQRTLGSYGFVFGQHINANTPELIGEAQERVKQLTKAKREAIAVSILDATYKRNTAAGKEEKDIVQRYDYLHRLAVVKLTPQMLLSSTEYKRTVERALWEHLSHNKTNGYALHAKAATWYSKMDAVRKQLQPGTYTVGAVKAIVSAVIGKQYDQSVNDVVGLLYDVQRKRQRTGKEREYVYELSLRQGNATNVGAVVVEDSTFDDFFTFD